MRMTQEMIQEEAERALREHQFVVWYQPQVDHSTGSTTGAEALVRWQHPEYGLQMPGSFIPYFEASGLIVQMDLAVFREVCRFLAERIAEHKAVVPVSFNISRQDILNPSYLDDLEAIRKEYNVPVQYLSGEITESYAAASTDQVLQAVNALHSLGYTVEMDDFGSGMSSLNVLKDICFDVIKLDMKFLGGTIGGRGGTIVSAVVRMCRWLETPVICEGVETREQADYMRSLGCSSIQGYFYSKPLPETEFENYLDSPDAAQAAAHAVPISLLDARKFWSPESLETLIFSNFVGGAAIFWYGPERIEIIRVNPKYLKELGMGLTEQDILSTDPWSRLDSSDRKIYEEMLQRAITSNDEEECETWRTVCSRLCGKEKLCIRASVRVLGKLENQYLFHAQIRNITAEKKLFNEVSESDRRFRAASEQANVYAWEYDVSTKEMRPCFRCMRDLGLPALVRNYPEPVIASGLFPEDYADLYRDWHRQIADGARHLEAVIPLTAGRVPFHVRYTTEFDKTGRPVKAYGSATLVVDENTACKNS